MYKTTSWWSCEGWFTLTHNSYVQDIMGCFQVADKFAIPTTNYQLLVQLQRLGKFEAIFPISKILLSLLNDNKSHLLNSNLNNNLVFCLSLSSSLHAKLFKPLLFMAQIIPSSNLPTTKMSFQPHFETYTQLPHHRVLKPWLYTDKD